MSQQQAALCMPLLRVPVELTPAALQAAWAELFPRKPGPTDFESDRGAFTFGVGSAFFAVSVMPVAVPNDETAGPASTAWLWPNAVQDLAGYRAHAIVWATSPNGPLAAFLGMTSAASAVVHATRALGVYVGGAGLVVKGDVYVGMAREVDVPIALWVDFRCMRQPDGQMGLFTVGMNQFGLMEIEVPSSRQSCGDLRLWAMSLAAWLVEERPTINPGETVGLSEDERIPVEHGPSMVNRPGPVMRLSGI